MYADDTSMAIAAHDPVLLCRRVSNVVGRFEEWCKQNKIMLNLNKTVYLNFHQRRMLLPPPDLVLSSEAKFLGLHLDDTLNFSCHVRGLSNRLNSSFYALMKLKGCLDFDGLLQAYYSLFYSHMEYCILLWGRSVDWGRVFIAQKRAVRLMFNLAWHGTCRGTFREHNLLTLPSIYILKAVVYVKSNIHSFPVISHPYNTRGINSLRANTHNTALFEKSPQYDFVRLYNKLPNAIKEIKNIQSFKSKVKNMLITQEFYSYREYLDFTF